jgi:hypothetical protein
MIMKSSTFRYCIFFLITGFILMNAVSTSFSQVDTSGKKGQTMRVSLKNSEGTEFWLCFERNYKEPERMTSSNELYLEFFITSDYDANVSIDIAGINYHIKFILPAGTVKNIKIPADAQVKSSEIAEKLGIHIVSDKPISVYGLNRRFQTTDTFLGLPVSALGTEYRAMCYNVSDGLMPQFAIVATENNTDILITPSVDTDRHPGGFPFKVTLNQGEVFQVTALNEPTSKCDLTGSYIKSNKKISVFSGHQCAYVPSKIIACNHLVEQMPPIPVWGKHFYIGRLQSRSYYTYRVLANEDSTRIFKDAKLVKTLNGGEYYENTSNTNLQITADRPVLVAQYSQGFKNGDSIGDPMMIMISPTQQFLRHYRFATPINGAWEHFINIIVPTKGISSLRLDGNTLDSARFQQLGLSRYSIAYIRVPFGTHTIEGSIPFGMYSYGFGKNEDAYDAYGTMGGQSFLEYEPARDTLPPMVEYKIKGNQVDFIIRDDRVDDSGLNAVLVADSGNMVATIPKIDYGAPQASFTVKPKSAESVGSMVINVTDVAMNTQLLTVCRYYDEQTEKFNMSVTEGRVIDCTPDPGMSIGAFMKLSTQFNNPSFTTTSGYSAKGKFTEGMGFAGFGGIYAGRRLSSKWMASARLSLENYGGTIEAPDSIITHTLDTLNRLYIAGQESRKIDLKGTFLNLCLGVEYSPIKILYFPFGINMALNLSKSVDITLNRLLPNNYVYRNGTLQIIDPNAPTSLTSMNTIKFGIYGGVGLSFMVFPRVSFFAEGLYNHFLTSMISDGDWSFKQASVLVGVRYKLYFE